MKLVRFTARCRTCAKKIHITLDQAVADDDIVCRRGHPTGARAAIENELIVGVNQDSAFYFECLVHVFDPDIRSVVYHLLQPWLGHDLALMETDDAVQDVYLDLLTKKIRPIEKSLSAYIKTMARNKAIDRMRKRGDRSIKPLPHDSSRKTDRTPEDMGLTAEQSDLLEKAIASLPKDQQEVYRLRRLEGQSEIEVGESLEIPSGTVKSRLHRAEASIRSFLEAAMTSVRSVR